jgi:hypothetical protein
MRDDQFAQWENNLETFIESQIGDYDDAHVELWRVAQAFNISAVVLQGYVQEGLPQNQDGTFSMEAVLQWMVGRRERSGSFPAP